MDQPPSLLPSLIPPGPPRFSAPPGSLQEEASPQRVNRQLRELFREAFDNLGGAPWLVEFASKSDQNARVFVQAISKLLPPANDPKGTGGVIIDVPWLTSTRLSYKRDGENEIVDVQVKNDQK
jgi:hypothetical protein